MIVQNGYTQLNKNRGVENESHSACHLSSLSWEIPFVQLCFMVASLPVCGPSVCVFFLYAASVNRNILKISSSVCLSPLTLWQRADKTNSLYFVVVPPVLQRYSYALFKVAIKILLFILTCILLNFYCISTLNSIAGNVLLWWRY